MYTQKQSIGTCFCHAGTVLQSANLTNTDPLGLNFMVPFLGVTNTNLWGAEGFTPVNPSAYGPGRKPSWLQYTPCIVTQYLFLVCCQWSRGRIVQAFRYLASVIYAVFHSSQFRVSLFNLLTFFCFTPRPTRGGGIVFELFVCAAVCLSVNKVL